MRDASSIIGHDKLEQNSASNSVAKYVADFSSLFILSWLQHWVLKCKLISQNHFKNNWLLVYKVVPSPLRQNGTQQPGNSVLVVLTNKGIQWQRFVTERGVKAFLPRECFTSPPLPRGSHPLNSFRHGTCYMQHKARWIRPCCLSNGFRGSVIDNK